MRLGPRLLLGTLALLVAVQPGWAACLGPGEPITGELRSVETRLPTGEPIRNLHLVLRRPICLGTGRRAGGAHRLASVRAVQVVPWSAAEQRRFSDHIGATLALTGRLGAPQTPGDTGDALLFEPRIVAVHVRPGGAPSRQPTTPAIERHALAPAVPSADPKTLKPPIAAAAPPAPPPKPAVPDLRTQVRRFVVETYLHLHRLDPYRIEALYWPQVDYFGWRQLPIRHVLKKKLKHYHKWPVRHYALIPGSLRLHPSPKLPGAYDVSFDYTYVLGHGDLTNRGRGRAELTLDVSGGPFRICREDGGALEYW